MSPPRRTRPPNVRQESSVGLSDIELVGLDRDRAENRGDEPLALIPPAPFRQPNTNLQLRHGDRRDGDIVTVVDYLAQRIAASLGVNQNRRIED